MNRRSIAAATALLLVVACGGQLDPDGTGTSRVGSPGADGSAGGEGGSPDAGARACPPIPGCSSATSCNDGCNECQCDSARGTWTCTERACLDAGKPLVCPADAPRGGVGCSVERQSCMTADACPVECVCERGSWVCAGANCACPKTPPADQSVCASPGQYCRWGCTQDCTCKVGADGARRWNCLMHPC